MKRALRIYLRRGYRLPLAVVASAGISLSGCVVGPDYHRPPLTLPPGWVNTQGVYSIQSPDLSRWWEQLGDPMLNGLIDEAVKGNLDVSTAKAKIREARAAYREAGGALQPSMEATASASRSTTTPVAGASTSEPIGTFNELQLGFDASWELDLFGANRRTLEGAGYKLEAANEELRYALLTMIGDIAYYYLEARGYQERIDLAQRKAVAQRETAKLTQTRYDNGSVSAADLATALALASDSESQIQSLRTAYSQDVHSLGVLLGREPLALAEALDRQAPIPVPPLRVPMGMPADLLRSRPDVRLAERQLAQSTAAIGAAEAARYPDIRLTGSVATSGTEAGDLARASSISWSFGPSVTIPIFQGGKLQAAVQVAQAQRDQYYLAFQSALLKALKDVEDSGVALTQERIRSERLASSAAAYQEAARLAAVLYRNGSTGLLELLDAQRSFYSAEDSLVQSRVAVAADYVALNKALGGGWNGAIDASRPEVTDSHTGPHFQHTD